MTDQIRLPVGETRPPAVLERVRTVSIGEIVAMVLCAHRFDPEDLRGWHTHEPEAVIRGWVQENAEATVARLLGDDTQDHSTRSPAWVPLEERQQRARSDDGTEQQRLVTDGGKSADGTEQCPECGAEVSEQNPIFDWWMCDDCEIAFNDDGEVTAR